MQSTTSLPARQDDPKTALRRKETAALCCVSLPTLDRWARLRADFPTKRKLSAGVTVFMKAEVLAWLEAQRSGEVQQ